jgi:hypothetical protein
MMRVAGFNFKKISVEKLAEKANELKINTKIDILDIQSIKSDFIKTKDELLGVDFSYIVDYEPGFAKIEFKGSIVVSLDFREGKDVLRRWKDKKMSNEFQVNLFNIILRKSNIKALELEDEMNLPLHIPFPSLKPGQGQEQGSASQNSTQ